MKKLIFISSLFTLFSFVYSCSTIGNVQQNYAHLYKSTGQLVDPDYIIYHHQTDSSKVFFQIESSKILYTRKNKTDVFSGKILLHYEILENISGKSIIDSGSFFIHDQVNEVEDKIIYGNFTFSAKMGDDRLMKIFCADQHRNSIVEKHVLFNKVKVNSKQFFLIKDYNDNPVFTDYIAANKRITIESILNKNEQIYLRHYLRDFPISPPPFTSSSNKSFSYIADTTTSIHLDEFGRKSLELPKDGFLFFQLDTLVKKGVTLFSFSSYYPSVKSINQMIKPTRYICSRSEYNKLVNSELIKSAIDYFWKDKTGSTDRAREIIKKYYNRVANANEHFTSYLEGWQTDRGMVSIIYGPPSIVSKLSDREVWVYGDQKNVNSLSFVFNKMENPFTENDYKLHRSPMYKSSWYKAVDSWRSGRAYWIQ